jgi:hypothetical protein
VLMVYVVAFNGVLEGTVPVLWPGFVKHDFELGSLCIPEINREFLCTRMLEQ